jgi:hypothetical protein
MVFESAVDLRSEMGREMANAFTRIFEQHGVPGDAGMTEARIAPTYV